MARVVLGLIALLLAVATAHPVEKVVGLLKDLASKAEAEGKQEEVLYTKFAHWCATSKRELGKAIAEGKTTLETLGEEIDSHKKNIETLTAELETLKADLLTLDQEAAAAKSDRDAGADLYSQERSALQDTIAAIEEATRILQDARAQTDTGLAQARSYVRSVLAFVGFRATAQQRSLLQAFAEPRPELKAEGDRDAHVKGYGFKSDSVIELLKNLRLTFQDELVAAEKAETNAINAYDLAKTARDNLIAAKKASQATKEDEKGTAEGDLSDAEAAHRSAAADLEADSASLSQTESSCEQKKVEWEERSKTRSLEVQAIETAMSILSKVTGVRTQAPGNPVPPPSPVSLLQLAPARGEQALRVLRQEAKAAHSKAFDRLVDDVWERVKHGDGAFDQVINSIQKMIHRLMNEQKEEDDHKNWCDQELSTTDKSIADKSEKVSELTAKIQDAEARAARLRSEAAAADEAAAAIAAHVQEATEIREIGKQENRLAIEDSEAAQTALTNAVAVLKDFYKQSGGMKKEAWEFVQAPVELSPNPSTWESGYSGVADPAAQPEGIVTILEKVSADFATMEAETRAQEESDQEMYEQDMKSCKVEKARREEESQQKKAEEKRTLEKKRTMEASRKSVQGELDATRQYLKDLQPACVQGSSTYEERRGSRAAEIEALHQAQELLQGAFEEKASPPTTSFNLRRTGLAQMALRPGA